MRRYAVVLLLALALAGCRVVADGAQDRTLMYWPYRDGAPMRTGAGEF